MADFDAGTFTAPSPAPGTPASLTLTTTFRPKLIFVQSGLNTSFNTFSEPALMQYGWGYENEALPGTFVHKSFQFGSRWEGLFSAQSGWAVVGVSELSFISVGTSWSGTAEQSMKITGITDTSITLTWTYVNSVGAAYKYDYLIIGGSEVHINSGTANTPTSTGNQNIAHGLSAAPSAVLFGLAVKNTVQNSTSTNSGSCYMRGFTDGTRQAVTTIMEKGSVVGSNPSLSRSTQVFTKCIKVLHTGDGTLLSEAGLTSIDGTNVSINWTTVHSYQIPYYWLAISGLSALVGSFNQPVTISVDTVDTTPVTAQAILAQSFGQVSNSAIVNDVRLTQGISAGLGFDHAVWTGDNTGITSNGTRRATKVQSSLGSVYAAHPTGVNTGSKDAEGQIIFNENELEINWSVADATAREWAFLIFGDFTPPAPDEIEMEMDGGLEFNSGADIEVLSDLTGIYTIIEGKTDDSYYDRDNPGETTDVAIPRPYWKTGYVGG